MATPQRPSVSTPQRPSASSPTNFKGILDGVSEELIKDADRKGIDALAARFDPPVSTAKCANVEQKRERLRCALKKAQGTMYDVTYVCMT